MSPSLEAASRITAVALPSGLQIVEIEDRLDVNEPAKVRGLGRPPGDQLAPGESRGLSLRQEIERIGERSERGLEIFQLCFSQAHAFERLR